MTTYSSTFSAAGQVSSNLVVPRGKTFQYSLSATWGAGSVVLEKKVGAAWKQVGPVYTADRSLAVVDNLGEGTYRLHCLTYENTITYVLGDVIDTILEYQNEAGETVFKITDEGIETPKISGDEKTKILTIPAALGKVGGTSGWVVAAAADNMLVTLPAESTGSTLVVPITGLEVGDTINSFYANGQIESAGNTATFTVDLRKMTAAAADVSDASVDALDSAISATEDTVISSTNSTSPDLSEVAAEGESFYFLVTATTAASTDVALQSLALNITRA